ncbi:hypothetical protein NL676_011981 [Syzygium grande]|nr:hypothetical protein NL676_011981 [Syzygium grande]
MWTDRFTCFLKLDYERSQWFKDSKHNKGRDSPGDVWNSSLIVAALIASATYQAALQPPSGHWQHDLGPLTNSTNATKYGTASDKAGQAVLGTNNQVAYILFLIFNTAGFFATVHMIYFLALGFRMQTELSL